MRLARMRVKNSIIVLLALRIRVAEGGVPGSLLCQYNPRIVPAGSGILRRQSARYCSAERKPHIGVVASQCQALVRKSFQNPYSTVCSYTVRLYSLPFFSPPLAPFSLSHKWRNVSCIPCVSKSPLAASLAAGTDPTLREGGLGA